MLRILFVCSGNTCRSPMAAAFAIDYLAGRQVDNVEVISAGSAAAQGDPASPEAMAVMAEYRLDLSGHRSRRLTREMVEGADLILTMTGHLREDLRHCWPERSGAIFTLKEYAAGGTASESGGDVPDPFMQGLERYRDCAADLKPSVTAAIDRFLHGRLEGGLGAEGKGGFMSKRCRMLEGCGLRIALGSDHAGYYLKEEIKAFLVEKGIEHQDFGVFSTESSDYPDLALKVAEAIAGRHCDRGILTCGTGIGVAITANKVPGIRAALCHDVFSARASREHNDANVLTMGGRVIGPGLARDIVEVWLTSEFAGGRHLKRLDKIDAVERKYGGFSGGK